MESTSTHTLPNEIQNIQFDIIIASDVIYGISAVPSLVTIMNIINADRVYIATRDGRRGIQEFLQCCSEYMVLIDSITFGDEDILSWGVCSNVPDRWLQCNHTIYVFGKVD